MEVTTISLDLAKRVFQVHAVNAEVWTCSSFMESGLVAIRLAFRTEPD